MPTEVLYRKWRPQRFADVSGQEPVKRTLTNALKSGKVSHAYLFSGPRGTGKTTMGRLLTKAINCERNAASESERAGEPCNECASCVAFSEGRALDLVELDGASNRGIDEIRKLRENAGYAPMAGEGAHKVYLIDEVHMLTDQAFNALLKIVEEPPPHIIFIMATTDTHKVPATIVSRCQRQDFKRIPTAAMVDRLEQIAKAEDIDVPREGLDLVARAATGSLRDAINLLEQICDSYGKGPSLEAVREGLGLVADARSPLLAQQALRGDLAAALGTIGSVRDDGLDLRQFKKEVVAYLRELLLLQAGVDPEGAFTPEQAAEMRSSVEGVARETILRLLRLLSDADLRQDPLSPLPIELALAESMAPAPAPQPAAAGPPAPLPRPAPPMRPVAAQQRPPQQQTPAPQRAAPSPPDRVPEDMRRASLPSDASPEEIASLVGSRAPVIPPVGDDEPAGEAAAAPANGNGAPSGIDFETWIDTALRPEARKRAPKYDALLNKSAHVVSWQDGILTLAVYDDFHKTQVESNRKVYEDAATELLHASVSVRCIIAPKPAKPLKSPLVQHAVEHHGAKIVSPE